MSIETVMQIGLLLLSFTSVSALLVTKFNKKFEDGIAVAPLLIILILYLFSLVGLLEIGLYLSYVLIIACYGLAIYSFVRSSEKASLLKNFFTPAALVFFLSAIIIFIMCRNNVVLWWDELRLWGAYPKVMFHEDALPLFLQNRMWEDMAEYPPGMQLLQYFGLKFSFSFHESVLYIVYYWFMLTLLVPIISFIKKKESASGYHWGSPSYIVAILILQSRFYHRSGSVL